MRYSVRTFTVLLVLVTPALAQSQPPRPSGLRLVVEAEEDIYDCEPLANGAGPLWCSGSTCLVRVGDVLFASGVEKVADAKPLNNCRWTLFRRGALGWERLRAGTGRTREPSPIAGFADGRLFLSANPTLATDPQKYSGPARPEVLQFSVSDAKAASKVLLPTWDGAPSFTEHSYRSFAADAVHGELILLQNIGYTHAEWTFLDRDGRWSAQGKLVWPWGAEYDKPQPIRVCYPNVALVDRAAYVCGVSDVVEPYRRWQEFKEKLTGRKWDYDFRRLFFTWSDDVRTGEFHEWIEIASRDKTCGWISPGDLWVAPDGAVHLVWTERAIDERLRDEFFPDAKQSHALNYAVVRAGKVVSRRSLLLSEEGQSSEIPGRGRFHVTPDGRLFVFCYVSGTDAQGIRLSENRLMELADDGGAGAWVNVPMKHPMSDYFTATVRGGSPPSRFLELLGHRADQPGTISYARIRLGDEP
ncbi:MAG: hypothetical protein HQ581_16120 [Planctomycetes bacterium]|nr:hypothetical protein [Planctomycetota bacterium]